MKFEIQDEVPKLALLNIEKPFGCQIVGKHDVTFMFRLWVLSRSQYKLDRNRNHSRSFQVLLGR